LQFEELCHWFAEQNGDELLRRLNDFESSARKAEVTQEQLQELFAGCVEKSGAGSPGQRRLLRPLLLEVLLRLFEEGTK
jgi:hypothetical protein